MTDVSGGNGAFDSIIWDGALGQYVAGIRGYDQGYWTVDLLTSANPLDFKTADGAVRYEIFSPTQAVYPGLVGDPNNPELQANADGSFFVYYTTWPASHGLDFSDTSLGRRLVTLTTVSGTSYQASSNFSGTQGQNQWSYTYSSDGEQYLPAMSWDSANNRWQGSEQYCLIYSNSQHPGMNCDSVRIWTAPSAGTVTLGANGNLSVAASCSSNPGVNIRILKNGSQIWPSSGWQTLAHGASYPFPSGVSTTVNAGDQLQFVVAHDGSDNYCDTTGWDQTVVYGSSTSYQASSNFSGTEGQSQWSYEQSGDGEQSFQNMNWDGGNNRWQGSEQYCLVGNNWQHPGMNCDSVRVWQAPSSGTVTLGANGNLSVGASCGNDPGVNIRILKNGSQIWPSSGWQLLAHGTSYTFPSGVTTAVSSGDQLQFVVAHAGSDNYCDTTGWDQTVAYS